MLVQFIKVRVSAGVKIEKVEEIKPGVFRIRTNVPAEKGKANARVLELIAKHFNIAKSRVFLESGATSREKIICIES